MATTARRASRICDNARISFLALAVLCAALAWFTPSATAQTLKVLHSFDIDTGDQPSAGLGMDRSGALYGTTTYTNSSQIFGGVFQLKQHGSSWLYHPLYNFPLGGTNNPRSPLLVAPDGSLYGTTYYNNGCYTCGAVFQLYPSATVPKTVLQLWNQRILYGFSGGSDGGNPSGALLLDSTGNLYGTTERGGPVNDGTIYEIEHAAGTENVLFSPQNETQGVMAQNGVVADSAGNLYGVFQRGGPIGPGMVYELTNSGSGWTEQVVWAFTGGSDGEEPVSVILDAAGNLFGATSGGGSHHGGVIFKLTNGSGGWTFTPIYNMVGTAPCGVVGRLTLDSAGNLYGVTACDGLYNYGTIFELAFSGGSYTYIDLYDFTGGGDGGEPNGDLVRDAQGNLYGTAFLGGTTGAGNVFELTP